MNTVSPPRRRPGFLEPAEVAALGFASVGDDVLIDDAARLYGVERISLGSHVRIDAFAVLSAGPDGISLGSHIHLGVGVCMTGQGPITLHDFANLSPRTTIFSSNDDYYGNTLTGPTIPEPFRDATSAPVILQEHVIVGSGSVILPGVTIGRGAAIGALTLVRRDVQPWTIVVGPTGRVVGKRRQDLLAMEAQLRAFEARSEE